MNSTNAGKRMFHLIVARGNQKVAPLICVMITRPLLNFPIQILLILVEKER
jgi:hypothetical protein